MKRSIKESVNSIIEIEFYKNKILIYKGKTKAGGVEVVGEIESIFS